MKNYIYIIFMLCSIIQNAFSKSTSTNCVAGKQSSVNLDVHSSSGYIINVTYNPCYSEYPFHSTDVWFGKDLDTTQVPKNSRVSVDAYTSGFGTGPKKNLVRQSVGDGMKIVCKYTIGYA